MKKLFCFVVMACLLLLAGQSIAQCPHMEVTGKVVDQNGTPLTGVAVAVTGTNVGNIVNTVTDANGNYTVSFDITGTPVTAILTYSKAGYGTVTRSYFGCAASVTEDLALYANGTVVPLTSRPVTWLIPLLLVGAGFFFYRRRHKHM